jgi:hypothetical protein
MSAPNFNDFAAQFNNVSLNTAVTNVPTFTSAPTVASASSAPAAEASSSAMKIKYVDYKKSMPADTFITYVNAYKSLPDATKPLLFDTKCFNAPDDSKKNEAVEFINPLIYNPAGHLQQLQPILMTVKAARMKTFEEAQDKTSYTPQIRMKRSSNEELYDAAHYYVSTLSMQFISYIKANPNSPLVERITLRIKTFNPAMVDQLEFSKPFIIARPDPANKNKLIPIDDPLLVIKFKIEMDKDTKQKSGYITEKLIKYEWNNGSNKFGRRIEEIPRERCRMQILSQNFDKSGAYVASQVSLKVSLSKMAFVAFKFEFSSDIWFTEGSEKESMDAAMQASGAVEDFATGNYED